MTGATPVVHAWPVIVLTFTDEQIVADANGEVLSYPVMDPGTSHEVAADAATEACRRLGLKACRVQGHTIEGEVFEMVVDAETGTLDEYELPAAAPVAADRRSVLGSTALGRVAGKNPRRAAAIWGSVGLLALTAAVPAVVNARKADQAPAPVVFTPPPAQLPVPAPAGWDTYAGWSTPMSGTQVKAILDWGGHPVSVEGNRLIAHEADTGVQVWDRTAPFEPTQLTMFTTGGQTRIAAATGKELVLFGEDSTDPVRVQVPQDGSVVLEAGSVPRIDLPTKKSLVVTADGRTLGRVVPAGAKPFEAQGEDLISVDAKAGKVWRVGTDSAALPKPATLPAPAKGAQLTGVLGSVDGRVVASWRAGRKTLVGFYDVAPAKEATSVSQVTVREVTGEQLVTTAAQVDREHGLLLASTVLVDVKGATAHRLAGQGKLAAGYAWVNAGGQQARVNRDGRTEASTRADQVAVPDVITSSGLAITQVDGAADKSLYALVASGPTPSVSSSPASSALPSSSPALSPVPSATSKETP